MNREKIVMAAQRQSRRKYVWVVLVVFLVLLSGLYLAGRNHDHAELHVQRHHKGITAPGSSQEAFHEVEPRNQLKPKAPVKKRPKHPLDTRGIAIAPVVQQQGQAPGQLAELKKREEQARAVVAEMKRKRVVMEQDPLALVAEKRLQKTTQLLLRVQYSKYATEGGQPGKTQGTVFQIEMRVDFPTSMGYPHTELIVLETAPIELMPHAVKVFLDIVDNWKGVRHCTALLGRGCATALHCGEGDAPLHCTVGKGVHHCTAGDAGCCPVCLHRSLESKTSSLYWTPPAAHAAAAPHCSSTSPQHS